MFGSLFDRCWGHTHTHTDANMANLSLPIRGDFIIGQLFIAANAKYAHIPDFLSKTRTHAPNAKLVLVVELV